MFLLLCFIHSCQVRKLRVNYIKLQPLFAGFMHTQFSQRFIILMAFIQHFSIVYEYNL